MKCFHFIFDQNRLIDFKDIDSISTWQTLKISIIHFTFFPFPHFLYGHALNHRIKKILYLQIYWCYAIAWPPKEIAMKEVEMEGLPWVLFKPFCNSSKPLNPTTIASPKETKIWILASPQLNPLYVGVSCHCHKPKLISSLCFSISKFLIKEDLLNHTSTFFPTRIFSFSSLFSI